MIEFESHPNCELCGLYESATNRGLPTRPLYNKQKIQKNTAILFVGQSPGYQEDQTNKSFIGYTGGLLTKFIEGSHLPDYCDIYLANSCRCKPPQGSNETHTQIGICRGYLKRDVKKLQANYKELIFVALGTKACFSLAGINTLHDAFKHQGMEATMFPAEDGVCPKIFFTYHPAMLHKTRKPALVRVVQVHFELLLRYIKGEFIPNSLKVVPLVGEPVPSWLPKYVRLDIETYGILAGMEQTVFSPHKSKYIDGIDYPDQIVTVNFTWRDVEGKLKTALYKWKDIRHRRVIRQWFRRIYKGDHVLEGQNIKFDLMYLAASGDKELQYWIQPNRLTIDDTLLISFLLFEQQPEKGLKELSTLFGIADYSKLNVTGKSGNAKSSNDKELHYYNCFDGAATTLLHEELIRRIIQQYGEATPKLSSDCASMRNMVLWDTFDLEMNGSSFDIKKVQEYHNSEERRCAEIKKECAEKYDLKISGAGSDTPLREFIYSCMNEAGLAGDKRIKFSEKTKKISIGAENINLLKKHLTKGKLHTILSLLQEFKKRSKIVNTYTNPLLNIPRKGIVLKQQNVGIVYPYWYPIPSYHERGGSSEEKVGGQIQGRISCKRPARQTEPRSIRESSVSRWPGGSLVEYDVSQDHLRIAALLSGDPFLMEAYLNPSESIHTRTARVVFPDVDPDSFSSTDKWKKTKEYHVSKTLNFLTIFRGGAQAFRQNVLRATGIELSVEFCEEAISRWFRKYHVYRDWQDKMIHLATKQGYLILPTGWSRTFGPPGTDLSVFAGEVLNFLHQTPCAQITQSSHFKALKNIHKNYLRSNVCLQIYDAIFVDIYPGEEMAVNEIMTDAMTNPPALPIFERWVGRSIPWEWDRKEHN